MMPTARTMVAALVQPNALLTDIPNTRDLLWVDFTAYDIWPPE